jgi:hypothetical protein
MGYVATGLFYWSALRPVFSLILQADPIDRNSSAYRAGTYLAYAFILIFVLAIVYAVRKRSRKK